MINALHIKKSLKNCFIAKRYLLLLVAFFLTEQVLYGSQPPDSLRQYELGEIEIEGCHNLDKDEIIEQLNLLPGVIYSEKNFKEGRERIIAYLESQQDFPFASLTSYEIEKKSNLANVIVVVSEGPQLEIEKIEISGPGKRDIADIMPLIGSQEKSIFSASQWDNDARTIAEYYEQRGYPFALIRIENLTPHFEMDGPGQGIRYVPVTFEVHIEPGLPVQISEVKFSGMVKTKASLAERVTGIKKGSSFDPISNDKARRRLLKTGWYSSVSQPGLFRDAEGAYGLVFDVKEQNTNSVSGALGYVPEDQAGGGVAGFLDIYLSNLMGRGRKIHLNWKRESLEHESFLVNYAHPYIFNLPVELRLNLSQATVDSYYVSLDYGAGINVGVGEGWTGSADFIGRSVNADSLALGPDSTDYRLMGYSLAAEYDHLDNPFNPRRGGKYKVTVSRLWNTGNNGPSEIRKQGLELSEYISITNYWTLFAGLNAFNVSTVGNEDIPVAELIRYGGAKTFRGYAEGSLLAEQAGWTNFEVRRGIGVRSFAYLLYDLGTKNREKKTDWDQAFGAGVQLETSNGLLNIAVAIPGGEGLSAAVVHAVASAKF